MVAGSITTYLAAVLCFVSFFKGLGILGIAQGTDSLGLETITNDG